MEQTIFIQLTKNELLEIISNEVKNALSEKPKEARYYTREEVCDLLHITKGCLHNYMRQGRLKALKLGGRTLFDANEIDKAIERKELLKYGRA